MTRVPISATITQAAALIRPNAPTSLTATTPSTGTSDITHVNTVGAVIGSAGGTVTTKTATMPTGYTTGDLLLLVVATGVDTTVSTPSGWTFRERVQDAGTAPAAATLDIFWQIAASASVTAPAFTFGTATRGHITIAAYRNVDATTPISTSAGQAETGGSTTVVHTAPGIADASQTKWAVFACSSRQVATPYTFTPGAGLVERYDADTANSNTTNTVLEYADSNGAVTGTGSTVYSATGSAGSTMAVAWAAFLTAKTGTTGSGKTQINLSWTAATVPTGGPAVTGYRAYQGGVFIKPVTATSTSMTGLTAGTTYAFAVSAVNADGEGPKATVSGTTTSGGGLPGAPTALHSGGTPTSTTIPVAWTAGAPDGTDPTLGFRVYATGVSSPVASVTGAGTTTATAVLPAQGTSYSLTVRAYNANGESAASNTYTASTASLLPNQVTGLAVSASTASSVSLFWNTGTVPAGASAINGYQVFQGGVLVKTVTVNNTTVSPLAAGTYSFQVAATNPQGAGAKSTAVSATIGAGGAAPGAPSSLAVTSGPTTSTVTLGWTAGTPNSTFPTLGYRVYRGTGSTTLLGTFTATSGTVSGLAASTSYTVHVTAYNAFNGDSESTSSNSVTFTTDVVQSGGTQRFRSGSWWEKPLPDNAPVHASNSAFISNMAAGGSSIILVGGAGFNAASNFWPAIYRPTTSDPVYHIQAGGNPCPAAFTAGGVGVRIPTVAKQYYPMVASANDSPMMLSVSSSVGPGGRGYYMWAAMLLWDSSATASVGDSDTTGAWRLNGTGASCGVYYRDSYGISGDNPSSGAVWPAHLITMDASGNLISGVDPTTYQDDSDNGRFRGCCAMIRAVDYDRVQSEHEVNFVMELFKGNPTASAGRFPMTGFESQGGTVPEGTRFRIRPTVDVAGIVASTVGSSTSKAYLEAFAIAKGLQDYGFMVADNSGSGHHIKIENTVKEGRGNLWAINQNCLSGFPFNTTIWSVVDDFFDPRLVP